MKESNMKDGTRRKMDRVAVGDPSDALATFTNYIRVNDRATALAIRKINITPHLRNDRRKLATVVLYDRNGERIAKAMRFYLGVGGAAIMNLLDLAESLAKQFPYAEVLDSRKSSHWSFMSDGTVGDTMREKHLTDLAADLITSHDLTSELLNLSLTLANERDCNPPLPSIEVDRIASSAMIAAGSGVCVICKTAHPDRPACNVAEVAADLAAQDAERETVSGASIDQAAGYAAPSASPDLRTDYLGDAYDQDDRERLDAVAPPDDASGEPVAANPYTPENGDDPERERLAEATAPPAAMPDVLTVNGVRYLRAGVQLADDCLNETCSYFRFYLIHYQDNNPRHGRMLEHPAYHYAEKQCAHAQDRVSQWLDAHKSESNLQIPDSIERLASYWEGRICA